MSKHVGGIKDEYIDSLVARLLEADECTDSFEKIMLLAEARARIDGVIAFTQQQIQRQNAILNGVK